MVQERIPGSGTPQLGRTGAPCLVRTAGQRPPLQMGASAAGAQALPRAAAHGCEARAPSAGKSAIHGWGAFAKAPHGAGDLVVEYCGALVRCTVADATERRLYNSLVGAGTYVFRLSDSLCVDATRAGAAAPRPRPLTERPRGAVRCTSLQARWYMRRKLFVGPFFEVDLPVKGQRGCSLVCSCAAVAAVPSISACFLQRIMFVFNTVACMGQRRPPRSEM